MIYKVIIIGASTVGKTTLFNYYRKNTELFVAESDDLLKFLNGGIYPRDSEYKMNKLAPRMVKDILSRERIIFFTNTHYFTSEDLQTARKKGFIIILLQLDRKIMTERSRFRQKNEGYEDHAKYFDDMFAYQKEIIEKGLVDFVVDVDRPVVDIANEIISYLKK